MPIRMTVITITIMIMVMIMAALVISKHDGSHLLIHVCCWFDAAVLHS